MMKVDLQGRIANTNLPFSRPLLPLFEAISNAIHAIEDAKIKNGRIDVYIKRDDTQQMLPGEHRKGLRSIRDFVVEDNGVGFTPAHYTSFETSDTQLKRSRGAKGIGRFIWLKAFQRVVVESGFSENGTRHERTFIFELPEGIIEHNLVKRDDMKLRTIIRLEHFIDRFEESCPKKADTIAERIIEHCLAYFLHEQCPIIILHDDDELTPIDLNQVFHTTVKGKTHVERFTVSQHHFTMKHVKLYAGDAMDHQLHLCATQRDVKSINLFTRVPALKKKLKDENGDVFVYCAYISSPYLDKQVNAERTDFNLPRTGELRPTGEIAEDEIISTAVERAKTHLATHLVAIREDMRQRIANLVRKDMPEFRPLLKSFDTQLDHIPHHLDDSALKLKLNEIQFTLEQEIKLKGQEMLSKKPLSPQDLSDYQQEYKRYVEQLTQTSQSRLAQYVVHRKTLLALLADRLSLGKDGKFSKEDAIHDLIFLRKSTSDDLIYGDHNLWVIDERLAYHYHLASDLPLNKNAAIDSNSAERPDLIVFNIPAAFVASEDPISSVVIIEFKRPERDQYERSPIDQVYGYIEAIRKERAKQPGGRTIRLDPRTPFYCYIVCDLTAQIQDFAKAANLIRTPDNEGYFGFNSNYNAYIEVISFDKLLGDAKKRNRVLFTHLGLADH